MLRHKYMPKANTAIKPGRERTATELGCGSTLYIYIDTISLFTQTLNGMSNKSRKLVLLFTFSRAFSYYFICYTQCTRHIVKLHETYYGKLKKRRKKILILAASLLTTTSGGGMFCLWKLGGKRNDFDCERPSHPRRCNIFIKLFYFWIASAFPMKRNVNVRCAAMRPCTDRMNVKIT